MGSTTKTMTTKTMTTTTIARWLIMQLSFQPRGPKMHLYVPVCRLLCIFRSFWVRQTFGQKSHLYTFLSLFFKCCFSLWRRRKLTRKNFFPQISHVGKPPVKIHFFCWAVCSLSVMGNMAFLVVSDFSLFWGTVSVSQSPVDVSELLDIFATLWGSSDAEAMKSSPTSVGHSSVSLLPRSSSQWWELPFGEFFTSLSFTLSLDFSRLNVFEFFPCSFNKLL